MKASMRAPIVAGGEQTAIKVSVGALVVSRIGPKLTAAPVTQNPPRIRREAGQSRRLRATSGNELGTRGWISSQVRPVNDGQWQWLATMERGSRDSLAASSSLRFSWPYRLAPIGVSGARVRPLEGFSWRRGRRGRRGRFGGGGRFLVISTVAQRRRGAISLAGISSLEGFWP
jgi:hypothetical protein